ncbi:AlpA family transcriptional regulator [Cupriavidus necator]|uniref:helix-turn-helix transcriptional regulator n=1 Tax=Cupriavidus necator TaxID=106590 RepID=UPI003F740BD6
MEIKTHMRIIRMRELTAKIGYSPSRTYELIQKGLFPAPFKLVPGGRAAGWLESDIDAWLEKRAKHGGENGSQ